MGADGIRGRLKAGPGTEWSNRDGITPTIPTNGKPSDKGRSKGSTNGEATRGQA